MPIRIFENRVKFGGPGIVIRVDEYLLRRLTKNEKGRLWLADLPAENFNINDEDENVVSLKNGSSNYRIQLDDGPWLFGLCDNNDGRYFVVQKFGTNRRNYTQILL